MNQPSTVALVPCETYDSPLVQNALAQAIELLGGWGSFVQPGERILLKPNLLSAVDPSKAVTTHPAVFEAAGHLLRAAGYEHLSYGDSPSGSQDPGQVAKVAGYAEIAQELGISLADFTGGKTLRFPEGKACRSFLICHGVCGADGLINLCKMKTHALERITGAVKNLYGCVYGLTKGAMHARYPSAERFARMLTDLNALVKPRLHVMDGIVAMEGNGPASGDPIAMKVILASRDPVALDAVFCHLIGLDPSLVPTNVAGTKGGLGTWQAEQIRVVTPDQVLTPNQAFERYGNPCFDVYREKSNSLWKSALRMRRKAPRRPHLHKERCIRCGICAENCPVSPKAIGFSKGEYPKFDYGKCIGCFCCQEMCPAKAITAGKE